MPLYYEEKKIVKRIRGGGVKETPIARVYKGDRLVFSNGRPMMPFYEPDAGFFRLTSTDINYQPLTSIPVIPRYGYTTKAVPLEYSYDNITWTDTDSLTTIYTSPTTGELYLRCSAEGNRLINNSAYQSKKCWKVGDDLDTYYTVEGDLTQLLDKNCDFTTSPDTSLTTNRYTLKMFSDAAYYNYSGFDTPDYINQCLLTNLLATGGNYASCTGAQGSKTEYACLWKPAGTPWHDHEWASWCSNWNTENLKYVQVNFKEWPDVTRSAWFEYNYVSRVKTYIPNELPEIYGYQEGYFRPGSKLIRFNVDDYINPALH